MQSSMKSVEIDGKHIIVRNKETKEAISMFKFDYELHKMLVRDTHMMWAIGKYMFSEATEAEAQTFLRMNVLSCKGQEFFYEQMSL